MSDDRENEDLTLAESIRQKIAGAANQPAIPQRSNKADDSKSLSAVSGDPGMFNCDPSIQNWKPLVPGEIVGKTFKVVAGPTIGSNVEVYEGRHAMLGLRIALRFLRPESVRSASEREAFFDEVQIQSALSSPYIANVFDYVTEPSGKVFMVEEFIDALPLDRFLDENKSGQLELIVVQFTQICELLSTLHDGGFVYLAAKPNHFLVTPHGDAKKNSDPPQTNGTADLCPVVKVIDFNRVQAIGDYKSRESDIGRLFERCPYPSPEQLSGGTVDRRSDVYNLGCLLYRLVSHQEPFSAQNAESLRECHLRVIPASSIAACNDMAGAKGALLDGIIQKAMSKIPADRYQSCEELAIAMSALSASN